MPDTSSTTPPGQQRAAVGDLRLAASLMRLHEARRAGDRAAAAAAWERIVVAELERVRGIVRSFQSVALPGGRIPPHAIDDVVAEVFLRLHGKADSLKGRSVGELRAFMRTATGFECLDFVRAHVNEDRAVGGSLDASGGGPPTATDHALAVLAQRLDDDGVEGDIAREMLHAGLALVDEDKRAVLIMLHLGHTTAEIMERFGISQDNVYQRRRRGLLQLRAAIEELEREDEDS